MKLCISSQAEGLKAQVDPRFGRCQYFVFVETDNMSSESFQNPSVQAGGGAGIQSAKFIADKGAKVVLTGNCGPNAFQTLQVAGVKVITGASGTIEDAAKAYLAGKFKESAGPNVGSKFGMSS